MITEGKAVPALLHDKCGDTSGSHFRICGCEDDIRICLISICNKDLATVQNVVITFQNSCCFGTCRITSGIYLR